MAQSATESDSIAVIASTDTLPTQPTPRKLNLFQKVMKYFNDSNEPRPDKKFDFGVIGGPHYSSTTKLGLGLVASGTYRMRRDSLTQLSNVSIYGDATTTGFLLIGVKGNNIFPENKYRIDYDFYLYTFPSDFWGIGYDNGNNNANKSSYNRLETIVRIDWLARLCHNLYGGITTGFNWVKGTGFTKPELLVCDEPVSALDASHQAQVLNLLLDLKEKYRLSYLFISHNLQVVSFMCDAVLVMYAGEIVEYAAKEDLFANPLHPYTKALTASAPSVGKKTENAVLQGEAPGLMHRKQGCSFAGRCAYAQERCRREKPLLRSIGENGHKAACHLYSAR